MDEQNDSASPNATYPPQREPTQAEWKAFSDALANAIFEPESIARVEAVVEENKRRQDQGRTDWVKLDPDEELLMKGVPPRKEMMRRLRAFMRERRARGEEGRPTREEYEKLIRGEFEGLGGEGGEEKGEGSGTSGEDSLGGAVEAAKESDGARGSSTSEGL